MSIPSTPSFIEVARAMNKMVPELAKNIKPIQPIMKEAIKNKNIANGLVDVGKRSKYFLDDFKANRGQAGRVLDQLKKDTLKQINPIKKITDALQKGLFRDLGGKWNIYGRILNGFAGIAQAGFTTFLVLKQGEIQGYNIQTENSQNAGIQDAFTRSINNAISIRNVRKEIESLRRKVINDVDRVSANAGSASFNARIAREKANDALYEVRQGRRILEERIARLTPNTGAIQKQINDIVGRVRADFQRQVDRITSDLNNQVQRQSRIQPATKQEVEKLTTDVKQLTSTITNQAESIRRTFVSTQNTIKQVVDTAVAPIARVSAQWGVTVTPATITPATVTPAQTGGVTITPATVTPATVTPARFSASPIGGELRVTIQNEVGKVERQVTILGDSVTVVAGVAQQAVQIANTALREGQRRVLDPRVDNLSERIRQQEQQINQQKQQLTTQDAKLREQERLNQEGNNKLDILLRTIPQLDGKLNSIIPTIAGIPLIAGRVYDRLRPEIPTLPQIETATGTAMCRNLRTGCGRQAIDDAVGRINNNSNQNTGATLDRLNAGLSATDLAQNTTLLNTILSRLGDPLPGGVSGFLTRFSRWSVFNTTMQLMTFAATVHNAAMLSNDIGQTLLSAVSNVLQIFGIKDSEGNDYNIGQIFSTSVANIIKSIVGESNYQALSEGWAIANRIYQASINVLNNVMNVNSVITNALEVIGGYTGKIGNALRIWGVVGERAYNWMNPQPSFDNKWIVKLQQLQDGANTVQMISQIPIDVTNAVTELTNSTTELVKAVKQEEGTKSGIDPGEAIQIKSRQDSAKASSAPPNFDLFDLFDNED